MKLNFLGRGAAFNTKEGNTSAYFIENQKLFLIDCGESVFTLLQERNILNQIKEIYVLISHTHSDHCGSLGSLGLYSQFVLKIKLKIVVPHNEEYMKSIQTLMTIFGNTTNAYEFLYDDELDDVFEAFHSVRYEPTLHDFMLPSYSFVFETPDGGVFYSSDTRIVDNMIHFIETHEIIDCIYMEVTDTKMKNDIHLYIGDLINAVPDSMRKKVWMYHLKGDNCIRQLEAAGFQIVQC